MWRVFFFCLLERDVKIEEVIVMLNQMERDGVTTRYAIGGAVGATFYVEPVRTLDVHGFITFQPQPGSMLISPSALFDYLKGFDCKMEDDDIAIRGWPAQFLPPRRPLLA